MTTLTKEQKDLFETLVRLGDSEELAMKTVVNEKDNDSTMYETAYYS